MRSAADILGEPGPTRYAVTGLAPGASSDGSTPGNQVGTEPLGSLTGAPPRTQFRTYQVAPGNAPTRIVEPDRAHRVVFITAPFVGFSIYVGDAGVTTQGLALTPGLPYEVILPGNQELYAITDSPVQLPIRMQVAPILIGDRERRRP